MLCVIVSEGNEMSICLYSKFLSWLHITADYWLCHLKIKLLRCLQSKMLTV